MPLDLSWSAAGLTLLRLADDLGGVAQEQSLLLAVVCVPIALLVRELLVRLAKHRHQAMPLTGPALIELWLTSAALAAFGGTLGGVIATNSWAGVPSHRYILPVLVLPFAILLIVRARWQLSLPKSLARTLELSLLAMVVFGTKQAMNAGSAAPGLPQYACLDAYALREGLHAGYAQYWPARPSTMFSNINLTINQVESNWKPRLWLNNAFWYSRGYWPDQERPLRYDFSITNGLDEAWISQRFGEPRTKQSCFDLKVWVYDRPEDLEFRNYLRTYAARATGDRDGWWESPALAAARRAEALSYLMAAKAPFSIFQVSPRI